MILGKSKKVKNNTVIIVLTQSRGTQRRFSVKYLFREANIAFNFLLFADS